MSIDSPNHRPEAEEVIWLLLFFALSFTLFAIQSGDVLMYLALARDFLLRGQWPDHDPYLYSRLSAELHIAHEYLSYLIFHAAWWLDGYEGLILVKSLLLGAMFWITLRATPRARQNSSLWILLWILAVLAGSFRFIERSSLFSDLFCILLLSWLVEETKITRGFVLRLTALFLLWVQLHPGFPLGLAMLFIWSAWHGFSSPVFRRTLPALFLPLLILLCNPIGIEGALYSFRFATHEALIFKQFNFEWFPTYHPAFRFTPEVLAFWMLSLTALYLVWRERAWWSLRGLYILFTMAIGTQAVRFVPWTSFALLLLIKPWAEFRAPRIPERPLRYVLAAAMFVVGIKNLTLGYISSSGRRIPGWGLDAEHFPLHTLEVLRAHPISGHLYNVHDYGSYLIWMGYQPIFHHGFVTDMDFYKNDVVGVFESQARFIELAKKYDWTMLLVDKAGTYRYFFKILGPLPNWKIVAEDDASYLIYDSSRQ